GAGSHRPGLRTVPRADAGRCLRPGGAVLRAFPSRRHHAQDSPAHGILDELHLPLPLKHGRTRHGRPMKTLDSLVASLLRLQIALLHARLRLAAGTDDEALHDLRIALQRLRSLLAPLRRAAELSPLY